MIRHYKPNEEVLNSPYQVAQKIKIYLNNRQV